MITSVMNIAGRAAPALALALAIASLGACGGSSKSSSKSATQSTAPPPSSTHSTAPPPSSTHSTPPPPHRAAALTKFAECMRASGIKYPNPNTSGNGPIFDLSGIDTSSTSFKAVQRNCLRVLSAALIGVNP